MERAWPQEISRRIISQQIICREIARLGGAIFCWQINLLSATHQQEVGMSSLKENTAIFPPIELPTDIARQRVLNEKTAAEFIGLSHVTLERMRKLGGAPRHLALSPRRLGYRVADLLKWLDERASAVDGAT
jgi:predicted DNA-binding transcriptional regulator AlpA